MTSNLSKYLLSAATAAACFTCLLDTTYAYQFGQRWGATATDGGGLSLGDGTTITWSIVPDGTTIPGEGGSDLIADFDAAFNEPNAGSADLTNRLWWQRIDEGFQRWGELSGNTYVYEPNDDGLTHGGAAGSLGNRGDVRIAGNFLDGPSGTLAFNFFPNNGDMVIDTGDLGFYSNPVQQHRRLRNVIMHEHGHGVGLFHVESANANFLMEPFINTSFDGPQLDDIRGIHRGYGDKYESNGGNQFASSATEIGTLDDGGNFLIGTDGRNTFVNSFETDFVSIGDAGDTDFFEFNLSGSSEVTIDLTPVGSSYFQGPQGGSQANVDTSSVMNLSLVLFDSNGTTQLASSTAGGTGDAEQILDFALDSGDYFVRVRGTGSATQLYELEINVAGLMAGIDGDFNDDGIWDCLDIDMLSAESAAGTNNADFDLNDDGNVNFDDVEEWLVEGGANNPSDTGGNPFLLGDSNLDGTVDGVDFIEWNSSKFTTSTHWCGGNFNGDGVTDGLDFVLWNGNKFTSSDISAVPEPSSIGIVLLSFGFLLRRSRRS